MNATFTKDDETSDGTADGDMPVAKLAYSDSNSDDAGDSGSLPEESASLGKQTKKPAAKKAKKTAPKGPAQKKMSYIDMIVEAIIDIADKKGATVPAIKAKIRENHEVNETSMKSQFKKSILKGIDNDTLTRPPPSQENKGVTGRFRVHPDYLKALQKSEKMKEKKEKMKKKKEELSKPVKKKAPAKVNTKDLKSLKEKSLTVKRAKETIKQARRSIGLTPKSQPKVAPKKRAKPPQKKSAAGAAKAKEKPTTSKSAKAKGATKPPAAKKAPAKKKTTKPK